MESRDGALTSADASAGSGVNIAALNRASTVELEAHEFQNL